MLLRTRTRAARRSKATAPALGVQVGDSQAILAGVAGILAKCGHPRAQLLREFRRALSQTPESSGRWDPKALEYVAKLPDVLADWHEDPRYVSKGQPRRLPLTGAVSLTELVSSVFPQQNTQPMIAALIRMGAVEKRGKFYHCVSRHLVFNGGIETYLRALLALDGILRTLRRNLAGQSTLLEQAAISARIPARDRPLIDRLARERGLPVLFGIDGEMRRRARHASPNEKLWWAGVGMYVIDSPFDLSGNDKEGDAPKKQAGASKNRQSKRRRP